MDVSVELLDARQQAVINFLARGTINATAELYEDATLLVVVPLAEPLGTVIDGVLVIAPTPEALIVATGTANRCVFVTGEGVRGWTSPVSDLEGDGEVRLESTTLYAGGYTRIIGGMLG